MNLRRGTLAAIATLGFGSGEELIADIRAEGGDAGAWFL
jgi:hypothetical protein